MSLYKNFLYAGSLLLVVAGVLLLLVQTIQRRWPEGTIVLLWFALPVVAISAGTSKLIHYVYPFVPPLALAAGYGVALALMLLPTPLDRALWAPSEYAAGMMPKTIAMFRRPTVRKALLTIGAGAVVIAAISLVATVRCASRSAAGCSSRALACCGRRLWRRCAASWRGEPPGDPCRRAVAHGGLAAPAGLS